MKDLLAFATALSKKWWALMSCAAFTFLSFWASIGNKGNDWVVRGTGLLAAAFLVIAAYGAWLGERRFASEQKSLYDGERARNSIPQFALQLGQIRHYYDETVNLTTILVSATITNHGAASPAWAWQANVRRPGGIETVHSVQFHGETFPWHLGNGVILNLRRDRMLPALTAEVVESGHSKNGRVLFQFSGDIRNDLIWNAATLHVGCCDRTDQMVWQQFGQAYPTDEIVTFPDEEVVRIGENENPALPN